MIVFDTLKFAKRLKEAGFSEQQAEAELFEAHLTTTQDVAELKREIAKLKRDIKELRGRSGAVSRTWSAA